MRSRSCQWFAVSCGALVAALLGWPLIGHAGDELPDLRIDSVTLSGQREVRLKITNASEWWADETSVTVETVSPQAGNQRVLAVENLDPGQSTIVSYTLAADCAGHVVKATVKPAKNYAGVAEQATANNLAQQSLCPTLSGSAFPPLVTSADANKPIQATSPTRGEFDEDESGTIQAGPAGRILDDVRVNPPPQELSFPARIVRSLSVDTRGGRSYRGVSGDSSDSNFLYVGWSKVGSLWDFRVSQSAVNFDLGKLHNVKGVVVKEAHLSFIEYEDQWLENGNQRDDDVVGCVTELGYATNDWALPPSQFMGPDLLFRDNLITFKFTPQVTTAGEPGAIQRWRAFDVTEHVQRQFREPDNVELWFGYVLHGRHERNAQILQGSCMSRIFKPTLSVTYEQPR